MEFLLEHLVESSNLENPVLPCVKRGGIWFVGDVNPLDDVSSSTVGEDSYFLLLVGKLSITEESLELIDEGVDMHGPLLVDLGLLSSLVGMSMFLESMVHCLDELGPSSKIDGVAIDSLISD